VARGLIWFVAVPRDDSPNILRLGQTPQEVRHSRFQKHVRRFRLQRWG